MNRISFALLASAMIGLAGCTACTPGQDKPAETEKDNTTLSAIALTSEFHTAKTGEEVSITIKTTPAGISLTSQDFEVSGGTLTMDGGNAKFKADTAGNYTIQAKRTKSPAIP